jgi:spore coat polysaccharide biosynthesis protein SpsF
VDEVLGVYLDARGACEYVSNLHPATWPDGMDVEVMRLDALEESWARAFRKHEREHTTPYMWEVPGRFATANVAWKTGRDLSREVRLTLDYREDYALIRAVFEALLPRAPVFSLETILDWLEEHPEIAALNARYRGITWYTRHLETATRSAPVEARA